MDKKFPTYNEFLVENELPIWAAPTQDIFNKSVGKYTDPRQHLNRFTPGDKVLNIVSDETKDMVGTIVSLEGIRATVRYDNMEDLDDREIDIPFDRDYKAEDLVHADGYDHTHDYTKGVIIPVSAPENEVFEKISYEQFNDWLTKLEDWNQSYMEDGENAKAALSSAHDKLKDDIGKKKYNKFNDWLDAGSADANG